MRRDEFPIIDSYVKKEINAVLEQIRAEISDIAVKTQNEDKREGLYIAREIVDRHR